MVENFPAGLLKLDDAFELYMFKHNKWQTKNAEINNSSKNKSNNNNRNGKAMCENK